MKSKPRKAEPVTYWGRPTKLTSPDTGLRRMVYPSTCGRYALQRCRSPYFGEYWLAVAVSANGGQIVLKKTKSRSVADATVQKDNRVSPRSIITKARIMTATTSTVTASATPNTDASKALLARLEANHPLPVSLAKTMQKPAELLINAGIAVLSKQANLAVLSLAPAHQPKVAAKAEPAAKPVKHQNPRMAAQKMMEGRIKANKAKLAAGTTSRKELQDAAMTAVRQALNGDNAAAQRTVDKIKAATKKPAGEQLAIVGSAPVDILTMVPAKPDLGTAAFEASQKVLAGKAAEKAAKTSAKKAEPKADKPAGKPEQAAVERPAGVSADAQQFDIYRREAGRAGALMHGRQIPPAAAGWVKKATLLGQVWAADRDAARELGAKQFAEQLK